MELLVEQAVPTPRSFGNVLWDWLTTTWTDGSFWRDILVAFLGIFVPAAVGWWWTRRKARSDRQRRQKFLYEVLFHGLIRNLAQLRHIRVVIDEHRRSPEARLHTGHFNTTVMAAVEVLEDHPDEYSALVNAHVCVDHLNRRLDQLLEIERLNTHAAQVSQRGTKAQVDLEPYVEQLLGAGSKEGLIAKLDRMVVRSLEFLDKPRLEKTLPSFAIIQSEEPTLRDA